MAARRNVSLTLRKGSPAFGPLLYSKLLADPARGQASRSHFLEHSGHFPALAPVTRSPLAAETHGVASDSGPNVGALVSATALVCVCVCVRVFMAGTRRMLRVMVLLSLSLLWGDCGNDTGPPGWARLGATRGGRPDERLLRMQEQETAYKMLLHVSRWRLAHGDHVFVALVR